jgi:predicted HTH transcriptional regulator
MGRILRAYDRSIFELTPSFLVVTFPFEDGFNTPNGELIGDNGVINGDINQARLSNSQQVLMCIEQNPKITQETIALQTGLSTRTISREIKALREAGFLRRTGSLKTGAGRLSTHEHLQSDLLTMRHCSE